MSRRALQGRNEMNDRWDSIKELEFVKTMHTYGDAFWLRLDYAQKELKQSKATEKELERLQKRDENIKLLANECIDYIKQNKPIDLWQDEIKMLSNGNISKFVLIVFNKYSSGILYDYAGEMFRHLDWSDEK